MQPTALCPAPLPVHNYAGTHRLHHATQLDTFRTLLDVGPHLPTRVLCHNCHNAPTARAV